jgi:hypothetical protein
VKKEINTALRKNYYYEEREWAYKNVHPRVIAEKYMVNTLIDNTKYSHEDYKFYCFNGEPKFFYVGMEDTSNGSKVKLMLSFFDLEFRPTEFGRSDCEPIPFDVKKPACFEEMLGIARRLSADIPFVRVDIFVVNNQVYFSEMTFYPTGGFGFFKPEEWEEKIGDWIKLPEC